MNKLILSLTLLVGVIGTGCTSPPDAGHESYSEPIDNDKVKAEAYLFDARLKQKGKPTSVRLHFYDRGDIIGIGGRGYLGKGALKGVLSPDTILVHFPASNEFVYEPIDQLLNSGDCGGLASEIKLFDYFHILPDSLDYVEDLLIERLNEKKKEIEFTIRKSGCDWHLKLTYDFKKEVGWRIKVFSFDNGHEITFKGTRRKFNANAKVKQKRFQVRIPPSASRIMP